MGLVKKIVKSVFKPVINNYKGEVGEAKVNSKLNPLLFGKVEHKQINDFIIIDNSGKSHQIDHIEIRHNGIFCIETKNYIGWIFGNDTSDKWMQSLYTGEKHYFTNPIKQNKSHIYHLSNILEKKYHIICLVVMVQNNADRIYSNSVVNLCDLKNFLKYYDDGTYYTTEEMENIYYTLISKRACITKKEHVQNIESTQRQINEGICPRCGGQLVKRCGTYGEFIGCSNYPNCKFTMKN